MRPRPAQVAEQLGVGAAGVLEGVREYGQACRAQQVRAAQVALNDLLQQLQQRFQADRLDVAMVE
jgi:hypothetical protein